LFSNTGNTQQYVLILQTLDILYRLYVMMSPNKHKNSRFYKMHKCNISIHCTQKLCHMTLFYSTLHFIIYKMYLLLRDMSWFCKLFQNYVFFNTRRPTFTKYICTT